MKVNYKAWYASPVLHLDHKLGLHLQQTYFTTNLQQLCQNVNNNNNNNKKASETEWTFK